MKKITVIIVAILLALLNIGCASISGKAGNRAARLADLKTFVLYPSNYSNIQGDFYDTEMLVFKNGRGKGVIDTICLYRQLKNNIATTFFVNVNIQDNEMRNIDSIMMRTDTKVVTLTADKESIKREVLKNGKIIEEIFFIIDSETVNDILYCEQISFQYKDSPFVQIAEQDEIHMIRTLFNYGVF